MAKIRSPLRLPLPKELARELSALAVLLIGNLLANQAQAGDFSTQPLTRVDCDKAEMAWDEQANVCSFSQPLTRDDCDKAGTAGNDSANVCGTAPQAAEAMLEVQVGRPMSKSEVQPLTRDDCDKAGMAWNDSANVCGAAPQAAEAVPEVQVAQPMPKSEVQPLTRDDCDKAGMAWNDSANVCGEKAEVSATQDASEETNPNGSTVLINIDKASQKMAVFLDDVQLYEWPVSTGLSGYTTPSGNYTARSMNEIWYSRQWDDAPMPHAVFFTKGGHAIHGTYEVTRLGKPASHGCVRLSPQNAATLYALVAKTGLKNTQVLLAGLTPGGEGKVASSKRPKSSYRRASRQYKNYYADSFPQRPRRGRLFRRLFGGR